MAFGWRVRGEGEEELAGPGCSWLVEGRESWLRLVRREGLEAFVGSVGLVGGDVAGGAAVRI